MQVSSIHCVFSQLVASVGQVLAQMETWKLNILLRMEDWFALCLPLAGTVTPVFHGFSLCFSVFHVLQFAGETSRKMVARPGPDLDISNLYLHPFP